jgi:hypothetical protein
MHPLELHYRKHDGRRGSDHGIGPIYSIPPFLQRGNGIGDFLEAYSAGFDPQFGAGLKLSGGKRNVPAATFYPTLQKLNRPLRFMLKISFLNV